MTDQIADQLEDGLFRLMYRSRSRLSAGGRKDELGQLFTMSRSNNKRRDITGALLVSGDRFVQMLEGEQAAVRSLFGRIEQDPRHETVELLDAGPLDERVFASWSMARVAADGDPDFPLIALVGEVSPVPMRGATPTQERVLDVMREAASSASLH